MGRLRQVCVAGRVSRSSMRGEPQTIGQSRAKTRSMNNQDNFDNAVIELNKAGIQAKRQAYGFSIALADGNVSLEIQCGFEHDDIISISVSTGTPPAYWFFRPDIPSMSELLINAKQRIEDNRSKTWLNALQDESNQTGKLSL